MECVDTLCVSMSIICKQRLRRRLHRLLQAQSRPVPAIAGPPQSVAWRTQYRGPAHQFVVDRPLCRAFARRRFCGGPAKRLADHRAWRRVHRAQAPRMERGVGRAPMFTTDAFFSLYYFVTAMHLLHVVAVGALPKRYKEEQFSTYASTDQREAGSTLAAPRLAAKTRSVGTL